MTAFTVWKFDSPEGAEHAADVLTRAADDGLVTVLDHAVMSYPEGAEHPTLDHKHDSTRHAAGWGAVWGGLAGALFAVPVVGIVAGASLGALRKATEDAGITDEDLERVREGLVEGTSVLFAVTEEGDLDRLGERFRGDKTLISTNLTDAERESLLEAFGG